MNFESLSSPQGRVALSGGLVGVWMLAFLTGMTMGGLVHLLLLAGLLVFPWRWLRS